MPVYEFECPEHRFDRLLLSIIDSLECPTCGKIASRVMSVTSPHVWKESMHTDSGMPMAVHNTLVHKNKDRFDYLRSKQGLIQPEDV